MSQDVACDVSSLSQSQSCRDISVCLVLCCSRFFSSMQPHLLTRAHFSLDEEALWMSRDDSLSQK